MKSRLTCILAGAVMSAGICVPSTSAAPPIATPSLNRLAASSRPVTDEKHEARRVMAETADRALGSKGVQGLLEMVARSDRDRIEKEMTKGDDNAYQALVTKINKTWKEKYGKEFNAEGHIKDLSTLQVTDTGQGHNQQAFITFPAEDGGKSYELHMTREKSGWWRIQLPDTVDGKTFYANAMKAAQNVDANSSKWPATQDAAYPVVVSQLLSELAMPAK